MKYREISRKLTTLGCEERKRKSGGSHRKWFNPNTQQGTIVPDWGNRDLKLGTIRSVVRQLGYKLERFPRDIKNIFI